MTLYLLHFSEPLGDPTRPRMSAQHYLGYSHSGGLLERLEAHKAGRGAAITRAAVAAGSELTLVAVMEGSQDDERRRKRNGNHQRLCLLCKP